MLGSVEDLKMSTLLGSLEKEMDLLLEVDDIMETGQRRHN